MILGDEEQRLGLTTEADPNVHTNVRLQNKQCFWHKGTLSVKTNWLNQQGLVFLMKILYIIWSQNEGAAL